MSSDSVGGNVAAWTRRHDEYTGPSAEDAWRSDTLCWGQFRVPEEDVRVLGDVAGLDVVELGCGTAFFGARLARRGARVVGVDPTPAQLDTARRLMREVGPTFELVEAPGESVPLPDASFDLAVSEHGAATWADPYRWVPEAYRLLRPGGRLVFMHASPLATLCWPDTGAISEQLQRPAFGLYALDSDEGVEYQLPHAEWIALFRSTGFAVERLVEVEAPATADTHAYYSLDVEWAKRWPGEEIWALAKSRLSGR